MKQSLQYFIVTDPEGAIEDDVYVPITHRAIIVDRSGFYAMESLSKKFGSEWVLTMFCQSVLAAPSGTSGRFTWRYDGDPIIVDVKR